jgi:hypothetical protein
LLVLAAACGRSNSSETGTTSPPTATASTTPSATGAATSSSTSTESVHAAGPDAAIQVAPPDTIIAQHLLVAYKGAKRAPKGVTRSKTEAKARAQEALTKVRSGAPFEDVVKQYSDDQGSAERLGSLGKFHKSDMDPAFSGAAFALKVGEVSDVVETPFGFHVIKRTQ